MKKTLNQIILVLGLIISVINQSVSQVGIAPTAIVPHPSAMLDIRSTDKGVLITRITTAQRLAIASPANGLLVFDLNTSSFWFYFGSSWTEISSSLTGWSTKGNAGTDTAVNFIGTTDNMPLRFRINNVRSGEINPGVGVVALGVSALKSNTTGFSNSAFGHGSLSSNTTGNDNSAFGTFALTSSVSGNANTATGQHSLLNNITGSANTASGASAMRNNINGYSNTAIGVTALYSNTVGHNLVAIGDSALYFNGDGANQPNHGIENTAIGSKALTSNTIGYFNTASGFRALYSNTSGAANTALGDATLYNNTFGTNNNAIGYAAMFSNITGNNNVALGIYTLPSNTTGSDNVAIGTRALFLNQTGSKLVAIGDSALFYNSTGIENTAVGSGALFLNTTGNYNAAFGFRALDSTTTGGYNSSFGAYTLESNKDGTGNSSFGTAALEGNTSGGSNSAYGMFAMRFNTIGSANTALGVYSLQNNSTGYGNTAVGYTALYNNSTGSYNSTFGFQANVSGSLTNATAIGAHAMVNSDNSIVLGSINGVNGATSSVNVGIGTQGPDAPLHVKANSISGVPEILVEENADDYARMSFKTIAFPTKFWDIAAITKAANANAECNFYYGGFGNVLVLKGNGNATLSGTLTQLSDSRLKTSITPLQNSLSNILKLNGYSYKWKDSNKDSTTQIGVIAQEVQKLFPQLVKEDKDGLLSVNYNGLVPVLINAVKEQQEQIKGQQQQINELLDRVKKLEKN